MSRVKLISETYVKNNSPLSLNIDDRLLGVFIYKTGYARIRPVLGTALYNKICSDITSGSITGIYKTILDTYIAPALCEWVVYETIPYISLKLTNKSVVKRSSESSQPADDSDVKGLRNGVRDMAELLTQGLTYYLEENISSISEYQNPGNGLDVVRPRRNNFFGGVYLGNGGRDNCNWGLDLPS